MIVELNSYISRDHIGNKAKSLVELNRYGYKVPKVMALDSQSFFEITKDIRDRINILLDKLSFDNIDMITRQIDILFEKISIDKETLYEIKKFIGRSDKYIIRTSIDGVDEKYTFAGIYEPIIVDNIEDSIIKAYKNLYSYNSLYYILKNKIDYKKIGLCLIFQKYMENVKLGFISTANAVTLATNELMIEIVDNKLKEKYYYDYVKEQFNYQDKYKIVSKNKINEIIDIATSMQLNYGYPLEIELAITKDDIYILQARELKNLIYDNYDGVWTKLNVNAKGLNYSLVRSSYDLILNKYYNLFNVKKDNSVVTNLLFNDIYINDLKLTKLLNNILKYDENYLSKVLNYKDIISSTKHLSLSLKRKRNVKVHENNLNAYINSFNIGMIDYQKKYNDYIKKMKRVGNDVEQTWLKLVKTDYQTIHNEYLENYFISLIEQNVLYNKLSKYLSIEEFDTLINPIEQLESYRADLEINKLISKINKDELSYRYWYSSSTLKILKDYEEESKEYFHPLFRKYIDMYGYLPFNQNDISSEFYVEDVEEVIRIIKKQLSNFTLITNNKKERDVVLKKLESALPPKKYLEIYNKIDRIQELMIKKSCMSNFLLKYHFLIKRYTKALAKLYLNKKIIDNENDIWYIDINYLYSYIDGDIDPLIIKENIKTNKTYYNSYRNYNNISYLGTRHNKEKYDLLGEGYSGTVFKGIVRKIKNLKELETLTKDDILVTKTLNDNLLFHLPEVSGIIVSDNYLSSNVKTILREMNIPCFMLDNCSKKLNNGDSITVYVYDGGIKNNKKR